MSEREQDETFKEQRDGIIRSWPLWKRVPSLRFFGLEYKEEATTTQKATLDDGEIMKHDDTQDIEIGVTTSKRIAFAAYDSGSEVRFILSLNDASRVLKMLKNAIKECTPRDSREIGRDDEVLRQD